MSNKLSLNYQLTELDRKNKNFYDNLSEEEKKKCSNYMMLKYCANVDGDLTLQTWYLFACNERVNKYFFDINDHPNLQWLTCTTASPGLGRQNHYWLSPKKKDGFNDKIVNFLSKLYPHMKQSDVEMLAQINTENSVKELAKSMGVSLSEIKKMF